MDVSTSSIANRTPRPIVNALRVLRGSFLLFVFTAGVFCLLISTLVADGIMAGMFGVWGISAILFAGVGYASLWLFQ